MSDSSDPRPTETPTTQPAEQTAAAASVAPSSDMAPAAAVAEQPPKEITDPPAEQRDLSTEAPAPGATAEAEAKSDEAEVKPDEAKPDEPKSEASSDKPSRHIRIGSQREAEASKPDAGGEAGADATPTEEPPKPKPTNPGPSSGPTKLTTPPKKYPPPNIRAAMTPEEQAELDAAMGGESLDEIVAASTAGGVGEELVPETRLMGKVATVHGEYILVDLGLHRQGTIPVKQFEGKEIPEVDADIDVVVQRRNEDEGIYELSLPTAAVDVGNWDEVETGQTVEVEVTGVNKGGLDCKVAGIRGFMPMGQISIYRTENAEEYVGKKLTAVITEAKRSRNNLVLSHRAVMERERAEAKEQLLKELAPGQIREGVVRSLQAFGAFVDLGGVDGLIHVSKLSWERVGHPKEVLSEGQQVKVKVERIDPDSGKIGLSYREQTENPWNDVESKFPVGSTVTGKVTKCMDFGAFVRLGPGVEGLIHISELAHGRVHRTSDAVSEGQEVDVKVLSIDKEKQRIALSLKALQAAPPKPERPQREEEPDQPPRERKSPKHLKGGISGPSGGEQFGLKW